jgi:dienelactone hydrolase
MRAVAAVSVCLLRLDPCMAQTAGERVAADLREEVHRIEVTVQDMYGRQETASIALTSYRPPGEGPFTPVIVSHGRGTLAQRAVQGRQRFELLARYLVAKGFAVFVPTRLGYGDTFALGFDPEESGPCRAKRWEPMATAASEQALTALAFARGLPWVDGGRWVALGQSVGGMASLAIVARQPPGLAAAINFAGGSGGDPEHRPGEPCGADDLSRLWRAQAAKSVRAGVPTLWIYWTHDRFWGEEIPRRWAEAWREGGGRVAFHQLSPWASEPVDGHLGVGLDLDRWVPLVEAFLAEVGFTRPGLIPRPPPSGFARVDEVDQVPLSAERREQLYRRFLVSKPPRAFAIGPDGDAGWASGDWALGRALGNCQWRSGQQCRLYAIDGEVVW